MFILWHAGQDDEYFEDAKLIGVYRTKERAHRAIDRVRSQPGFREHPKGFVVDTYELDRDHWVEGFGPA